MTASKRLGQCFLNSPAIINSIADALPLKGKAVLEIGGGHGELTAALTAKAKSVRVIETDANLVPYLEKLAGACGNIDVVQGDALQAEFKEPIVFGNLPYYISTPLLLKILDSPFKTAVLMVQKEFGERMVAQPKSSDYSRLTIAVASRAKCEILMVVPAECFSPQPKVDSVVVRLDALPVKSRLAVDDDLVRALFQHKNQSVKKALRHSCHEVGMTREEAARFAESTPLASVRVRELPPEAFAELSLRLGKFWGN